MTIHRVLLVGCGAEIGSMLVGMLVPERDGLEISAILTHPIPNDPKHPGFAGTDSLVARIILAEPSLLGQVEARRGVHGGLDEISIRGRQIPVLWGEVENIQDAALPGSPYDIALIATSKSHINNPALMKACCAKARYVLGVAESLSLPALYPSLLGAEERLLTVRSKPIGEDRVFALGSCQSNGWQALLRSVIDLAERESLSSCEILGLELDIIHPDTPTGRLGTRSLAARDQDPRDNLRPSFSQVEQTMARLFPGLHGINTVSLRTLIQPPGYQIARFFFRYQAPGGRRLERPAIEASLASTSKEHPSILHVAALPLGSHGFSHCDSAAVLLPQAAFLRWQDDPFTLAAPGILPVSELILQAYVHNTRGYCRSVIEACRYLAGSAQPRSFPPGQQP
jgi:hypothetical protein